MSRFFDDGAATDEYFERTPALFTAPPFTMVAWCRSDDGSDDHQQILSHGQAGTNNFWRMRQRIVSGFIRHVAEQTMPGRSGNATSSAGPTVNVWYHAAAVAASATDRTVYFDGGSSGNNTTDVQPKSVDASWIAQSDDGSPVDRFSGNIAHVAMWDAALTASEIATLAAGVSPLRVRPGNLVHYWPLNGSQDGSVEIDIIGGASFTKNGSPSIDIEPPVPHSMVAP
jgi:hypothetical protein